MSSRMAISCILGSRFRASSFGLLFGIARRIDFKFKNLLKPFLLSLLLIAAEGASLLLLLPLLQGILSGDYSIILGTFGRWWPQITTWDSSVLLRIVLAVTAVVSLSKSALDFLCMTSSSQVAAEFSHQIRYKICSRYLTFGKSYFDGNHPSDLSQLLGGYTERLGHAIQVVRHLWSHLAYCFFYIGVLLFISWKLTMISFLFLPLLLLGQSRMNTRAREASHRSEDAGRFLGHVVHDLLNCLTLIKLSGAEDRQLKKFQKNSEQVRDTKIEVERTRDSVGPVQEAFGLLVLLCLLLILTNTMGSGGKAGFYLVYVFTQRKLVYTVNQVLQFVAQMAGLMGALTRISEALGDQDKVFESSGTRVLKHFRESIEVRGLTFKYGENKNTVLKNLSLDLKQGEVVALVGPTGGGKSTLAHLLVRLYDAPLGTIRLDGREISDYTLSSLRSKFALVTQDVVLLNDSIRNNLLFGSSEVSDHRLQEIVCMARLDAMMSQLPQGWDTQVGSRGVRLSGGEKQRISIARAFLKDPEILILDESTSSLDVVTESQIQEAINALLKGRTGVIIAHRLSTVKRADRIMFLDRGMILEEGTPEELLARKGRFTRFWEEASLKGNAARASLPQ